MNLRLPNPTATLRLSFASLVFFWGSFVLRLICPDGLTESQFLLPNTGDMQFYNDWALRILRGEWTEHAAFYGLPLYAYLLAAIYKSVVTARSFRDCSRPDWRVARPFFSTNWLARFWPGPEIGKEKRARRMLRGKAIGLLAAVGWAFFQPAQAYSVILMPTSWLVFVFWFVVWQIVKRNRAPRMSRLFLFGVLVGFTAMGIATDLVPYPARHRGALFPVDGHLSRRVAGAAIFWLAFCSAPRRPGCTIIMSRATRFSSPPIAGSTFGSATIQSPTAIRNSRPVSTPARKRCCRIRSPLRRKQLGARSSVPKFPPSGRRKRGAWIQAASRSLGEIALGRKDQEFLERLSI